MATELVIRMEMGFDVNWDEIDNTVFIISLKIRMLKLREYSKRKG